jgi:1-acyl-sn-glycerol-3-phosphate acyltransferase
MPGMSAADPVPTTYRVAMSVCSPIVRQWGRLDVGGLEALPPSGPALIALNHDSYWDPVSVGVAALGVRPIRALAKSSMWKIHGLNRVLDGMGQIPIDRGAKDEAAMSRAVEELRAGACIGVFPEGTRSLGRVLRPRSGIGRLARAVPEAEIICCAVTGTVDVPRFPKRPQIRVDFFRPAGGGLADGEELAAFSTRLLAEVRDRAPIAHAGRHPGAPPE